MKTVFTLGAMVVLISSLATAGMAAEQGSWAGWIADANCAKSYEKAGQAGHAACAKSCVEKGAKWALAMKEGHVLLEVDGKQAEQHLGHEVLVKGELNEETNTVKVTAIELPSS